MEANMACSCLAIHKCNKSIREVIQLVASTLHQPMAEPKYHLSFVIRTTRYSVKLTIHDHSLGIQVVAIPAFRVQRTPVCQAT